MAMMAGLDILVGGLIGGLFDWQGVIILLLVSGAWRWRDQRKFVMTADQSLVSLYRDMFMAGVIIGMMIQYFWPSSLLK